MRILVLLLLLLAAPVWADTALHDIIRAEDARDGATLQVFIKSPDPAVRGRAIRALGRLQQVEFIALLAERAARDDAPSVRAEAIFALGQTGTQRAEPPLLDILAAARTPEERLLAITALGQATGLAGPIPAPAGAGFYRAPGLQKLLSLLADPDAAVRATTLAALEDYAYRYRKSSPRFEAPPETVTRVIGLLDGTQPAAVRAAAAGALWRFAWVPPTEVTRVDLSWRAAALTALVRNLKDDDPEVRMRALQAIGEVAAPSALPATVGAALQDRDWRVRVSAVEAIGKAAPDRAWPIVLEQQLQDPHPLVVLATLRTLESLAKRYGGSPGRGVYGVYLNPALPLQVRAEALRIALAFQEFAGQPAPLPFGTVGPPNPHARPGATAELQREWRLRRALAEGSVQYLKSGLDGVPADAIISQYQAVVRPFLTDADARVRTAALEALGPLVAAAIEKKITSLVDAVKADLLTMLSDRDAIVRAAAADALADQGVTEAVPAIVATLQTLKSSADVEVMVSLIEDLGKLKDRRSAALLDTLSRDPDGNVARAAGQALAAISGGPSPTVKAPRAAPPVPAAALAFVDRATADPKRPVRAVIHTGKGDLTLRFFTAEAPLTTYNFVKLAKARYFDGLTFHRVVPNFVVQGGDPRGDGWGGPGYSIRCEYNPLTYGRGTVGMALAGKDTGGSQFFITHSPQPRLNGRYTIFAQLVAGDDVLDRLTEGDRMTVEILEP